MVLDLKRATVEKALDDEEAAAAVKDSLESGLNIR